MSLAIRLALAVTPPVLTGVLIWWGVMLAAPALLIGRWRRRRRGAPRRRLWLSAVRARRSTAAPPSPAEPLSAGVGSGRLRSAPARLADGANNLPGRVAEALVADGETPRVGSQGDSVAVVGLRAGTLAPLCRYVDFHRRLELTVAELERRLSSLPAGRWRIEPYPLTGERRNTLLLLGETGVFAISATYAPGHWDDVIAASKLAGKVQALLPGYPGQVQPAICHPFTAARPRLWHRPDEDGAWVGAWVVGGDSVIDWLEHFGVEHGLGPADLGRFDELAKPNWLKSAIPTAPSWPPIPEAAPPGRHQ
jgi:hypothetical protein